MYVAVKGGARAIANAHRWQAEERRGDQAVAELSIVQIREQLTLAVNRVMSEAALYDADLAALALKQARGDAIEAAFLLRAYKTTLPRVGQSLPIDTAEMRVDRRVSAVFKEVPGGQLLGPTFDYSHRLLDFALAAEAVGEGDGADPAESAWPPPPSEPTTHEKAAALLARDGLIEPAEGQSDEDANAHTIGADGESLELPAARSTRLHYLTRGDEGFLLALAYSSQRGFGNSHPFVGELRIGTVTLTLQTDELPFAPILGELTISECDLVTQFTGSAGVPPQFSRGYGLVLGHNERKAIAMAVVDRALRADAFGEEVTSPVQDQEFVLMHADNVQAAGFLEHLKLPHYVDFQSELELLRKLRAACEAAAFGTGAEVAEGDAAETAQEAEIGE